MKKHPQSVSATLVAQLAALDDRAAALEHSYNDAASAAQAARAGLVDGLVDLATASAAQTTLGVLEATQRDLAQQRSELLAAIEQAQRDERHAILKEELARAAHDAESAVHEQSAVSAAFATAIAPFITRWQQATEQRMRARLAFEATLSELYPTLQDEQSAEYAALMAMIDEIEAEGTRTEFARERDFGLGSYKPWAILHQVAGPAMHERAALLAQLAFPQLAYSGWSPILGLSEAS